MLLQIRNTITMTASEEEDNKQQQSTAGLIIKELKLRRIAK
jgi:hypothetical protein